MGEESIAQKTLTRRQGTADDGRKRKKESRGKGRVDLHTEQAIRLGKKKKKIPKR